MKKKYFIVGYGKEETEYQWQKFKDNFIIELDDDINPYEYIQEVFPLSLKNWLITITEIGA